MRKNTSEILYQSKYPIIGYFGIILYAFSFGIFSYHMFFGELPILNGFLFLSIAFLAIDWGFCGYSGKILLTRNELSVKYFFPWRENKSYKFRKLISIDTHTYTQQRLHSILYMEDDQNGKYRIKLQSNYGFLKDISDFKNIVKRKLRI